MIACMDLLPSGGNLVSDMKKSVGKQHAEDSWEKSSEWLLFVSGIYCLYKS